MKHLQGSDDVIFSPATMAADPRRARRRGTAGSTLLRDTVMSGHYRTRIAPLDSDGTLARTWKVARITEVRWDAILMHVDLVTRGPGSAERKDIDNLPRAGLSSHAVVSLSQLIAYVNSSRAVLAGFALSKVPMSNRCVTSLTVSSNAALGRAARLNQATETQLVALKVTPSNARSEPIRWCWRTIRKH